MLVIGNFSDTRRIKPVKKGSEAQEEAARRTEAEADLHLVQIPPFHTGHLGFVPEKTVLLTGPLPQDDARGAEKRTCEVVVTPHAIGREILKVSCTFDEGPHVLERLVNLLTHLNVNIVALESASVFESKHHMVHMVLDMSRSILSDKQMTDGERSKFIDVLPNLRISNRRGLELFLYIVVQCHHILRWKEGAGSLKRHIPQVFVSEFDEYEWTGEPERPLIHRGAVSYRTRDHSLTLAEVDEHAPARRRKARETYFKLPKARGKRIETLLNITEQQPLDYLLLSDTESRSLRIQFFQSKHRKQIFELGFKHQNEIGALHTILRTVANSNFNVLSCLIREIKEYENVWEAVLEYQGSPDDLDGLPTDPRLAMQELLAESVKEFSADLAPYEVGVFIPTHLPDKAKYTDMGILTGWDDSIELVPGGRRGMPERPSMLPTSKEGPLEQNWLITYADEMLFKGPKIFISCPSRDHALKYQEILQRELKKDGWEPSVYADLAKMQVTYAEAKQLIADADYFVGIWIPDEVDNVNGAPTDAAGKKKPRSRQPSLSPWMHFEMGLAVASDRDFKILASKRLENTDVVRRIAADRPVFMFEEEDDAAQFKKCVKSLRSFMDNNWRHGREPARARQAKRKSAFPKRRPGGPSHKNQNR